MQLGFKRSIRPRDTLSHTATKLSEVDKSGIDAKKGCLVYIVIEKLSDLSEMSGCVLYLGAYYTRRIMIPSKEQPSLLLFLQDADQSSKFFYEKATTVVPVALGKYYTVNAEEM